jgi:hypothetical protein
MNIINETDSTHKQALHWSEKLGELAAGMPNRDQQGNIMQPGIKSSPAGSFSTRLSAAITSYLARKRAQEDAFSKLRAHVFLSGD